MILKFTRKVWKTDWALAILLILFWKIFINYHWLTRWLFPFSDDLIFFLFMPPYLRTNDTIFFILQPLLLKSRRVDDAWYWPDPRDIFEVISISGVRRKEHSLLVSWWGIAELDRSRFDSGWWTECIHAF